MKILHYFKVLKIVYMRSVRGKITQVHGMIRPLDMWRDLDMIGWV